MDEKALSSIVASRSCRIKNFKTHSLYLFLLFKDSEV